MENLMSVYEIPVGSLIHDLSSFKDQFVLIVNIADHCGYSTQLQGLQSLHEDMNVPCTVVAFPSNQFSQQIRDSKSMQTWCAVSQKLTFPVEEIVLVNGKKTHPLFQYLKRSATGMFGQQRVMWNYTKFLIYPGESNIIRFSPAQSIESIASLIHDEK